MTWNELKTFCNSLPESELGKNVIMWREDETVSKIEAQVLDEDHYTDEDSPEDGCFEKSVAEKFIQNNEDAYPDGIESFKKVYDKGHPVLWENFIFNTNN